MTGGCKGFGKNIMRWPEDLIVGGVKREGNQLVAAEALQSVFLVSSPFDVFIRYKEPKPEVKPRLDTATWSPAKAEQVIVAWQRNFTQKLYAHKANLEVEGTRVFHPLASTSIADMLEEFSQFNYTIIFLGYALMVCDKDCNIVLIPDCLRCMDTNALEGLVVGCELECCTVLRRCLSGHLFEYLRSRTCDNHGHQLQCSYNSGECLAL